MVDVPDADSKYPYFSFADVSPTQDQRAPHLHDGYGMLLIVEGSYEVTGRNRSTGTLTMTEPRHWSGECIPGPAGAIGKCVSSTPDTRRSLFQDQKDRRVIELFASAPSLKTLALLPAVSGRRPRCARSGHGS